MENFTSPPPPRILKFNTHLLFQNLTPPSPESPLFSTGWLKFCSRKAQSSTLDFRYYSNPLLCTLPVKNKQDKRHNLFNKILVISYTYPVIDSMNDPCK